MIIKFILNGILNRFIQYKQIYVALKYGINQNFRIRKSLCLDYYLKGNKCYVNVVVHKWEEYLEK